MYGETAASTVSKTGGVDTVGDDTECAVNEMCQRAMCVCVCLHYIVSGDNVICQCVGFRSLVNSS